VILLKDAFVMAKNNKRLIIFDPNTEKPREPCLFVSLSLENRTGFDQKFGRDFGWSLEFGFGVSFGLAHRLCDVAVTGRGLCQNSLYSTGCPEYAPVESSEGVAEGERGLLEDYWLCSMVVRDEWVAVWLWYNGV